MESQTPPGAVPAAGKEKAVIEKRIYCDICSNQIKSYQVRYILRRRMFLIEDDPMGGRRKMDICKDCYNRLVDMVIEGGTS